MLVVDDDQDDVLLTSALLRAVERTRFDVDTAATMEEVEAFLAAGPHDVYLVDYGLARVTGIDVARRILRAEPHAAVIMLTGYDDYAVDVRAAEVGVVDYLVKGGLDARALERSIRYAVKQQQAVRALAASEERYAVAMAGAQDGLWDWDLGSDTLYYSERYKAMLGCRGDELGTAPREWLQRIHAEDRPQVEQALRDHLAGRTDHYESEHRMRGPDGTYRWVLSRGLAVRGPDGRPSRLAGSQSDVTERKRAQLQLEHDALHDVLTGLPNACSSVTGSST